MICNSNNWQAHLNLQSCRFYFYINTNSYFQKLTQTKIQPKLLEGLTCDVKLKKRNTKTHIKKKKINLSQSYKKEKKNPLREREREREREYLKFFCEKKNELNRRNDIKFI